MPFPAPPGPERTRIRTSRCASSSALALVGPETLEPTALADPHRLHEPTGLDLPEAGKRLEHREHLHLADGLVLFGIA